jgi:hypothetical protein
MRNALRKFLLSMAFVLSFQSLSPAESILQGRSVENPSRELIFGRRILPGIEESNLASSLRAWVAYTFSYEVHLLRARADREFLIKPEADPNPQIPPSFDNQKREFSLLEKGQLWKEKSSYHFANIPFPGSKPESFLNFIPCLSVAKSKEDPPSLLWNSEGFKESVILKSLAILLELKLSF